MTQIKAPPIVEEKEFTSSVFFESLPESDTLVATLMGAVYLGVQDFDFKGTVTKSEAVEFHWGMMVDDKAYFIKTWPKKWMTNEKSHTAKVYKALTGELPHILNAADMVGKAAMLTVENVDKVSRKGTKYVASKIIGTPTAVPKALRSAIVPFEDLEAAWLSAMEPKEQAAEDDSDAPF